MNITPSFIMNQHVTVKLGFGIIDFVTKGMMGVNDGVRPREENMQNSLESWHG